MAIKYLHLLPRVEDGWSFLYVQQCRIEQDGKSISVWEDTGRTAVPCAALSLLMLGPGTAITHAAVRTLAESGCMILDRKSTRLNSSHLVISYAVFCLKNTAMWRAVACAMGGCCDGSSAAAVALMRVLSFFYQSRTSPGPPSPPRGIFSS